ncbi:hypothetical protein A3A76_04865 [Candidatus Woesebacteria bacterium RIFCSPLOWO2_01_FULL_39_23]|uniref:DNA alkylation repair protein n=2 Tax=Microgenomates group TaxID=1794810 RepID=A0A1F7YK88_9BACT|nr:putative DNA alkylation repair enzyme [uncultured Microgenomates bacterium Rifle_16ft_4_minimus_37633]OGM13814.1 MAG: hypothetical protein A2141_04090 [Candidatus Woesebacteria bacterium RBG_16_40_11]OGM27764.1 MAG: hypothetical protein A2628_05085 [Candidatus Woesebacteria bacterium RIFCSPHIGHO2_01_FULL_40_22]OGM36055.1 MAG: hypothetical protein A3E41_04935 [Candidatus Woesebacteria bacterium RIFCSPHIGHO2_12_FULL_38_9]OGM62186.1 MAG: hypothetical protein A3A76_04865 [Candidatus Woesebacteri
MNYQDIINKLESLSNPKNIKGMARFGITPKSKILGISIYNLRKIAKEIKKSSSVKTSEDLHAIAKKLWSSNIHEARILASFIEDPTKVTEKQLDQWVKDFDSWDIVDLVSELIAHTPHVIKKINEWANYEEPARNATQSVAGGEFVKRSAFSLIAELAWWDKKMTDKEFIDFFPLIKKAATDERNYVKKSVNWAIRNIGKRNKNLNKKAIKLSREIQKIDSKSARWTAANALRELTSEKIQTRLK